MSYLQNELYTKYKREANKAKKLEKENTELKVKKLSPGVYITLQHFHSRSCRIIQREGKDYLTSKGPSGLYYPERLYYPDLQPDLFIRFAELPTSNEAYREFFSAYGLPVTKELHSFLNGYPFEKPLSLINYEHGDLFDTDCPPADQPISLISNFHNKFKEAYQVAKKLIKEEEILSDELEWLRGYLDFYLKMHCYTIIPPKINGGIWLSAENIIGVLVLQLYRFIQIKQELRICQLPNCLLLTTNPKFCTKKHQKLFDQWKRRNKIENINGNWILIDKPRGRPKLKEFERKGKNGKRTKKTK